ncbi:MAG: sugar ABC transporter substrate-binding protein [Candidatus Sericytochromatia bacterium]
MKSLISTLCLASILALTGCAPNTSQRVQLTLWLDTNDREMQFFKRAAHQIEEAHPHLRLRLRFVQFDDLKPRFQGQVGETREPDILYMMNDWVGELVEQNLLRPLSFQPTGLVPQAVQSMSYQQQLYGAPFAFQTIALIYNTAQVAQPPVQSAELFALQSKPHPKEHYTLLYDQRNFYYHAPWFHACGGEIFDAQGRFALQPEPLSRSLRWAYELQQRQVVPAGSSYSVMLNLFSAGEAALMIGGPWSLNTLSENQLSYGIAPLPHSDCPGTPQPFIGVKGFGVNRLSNHPKEAEEVLAWLTSAAAQEQVLAELDNLPVLASIYDGKRKLPAEKRAFYSQLQQGRPMPNHPLMKDVWQEMNWLLGQVFDGQPREARLAEAVERLQRKARDHGAR